MVVSGLHAASAVHVPRHLGAPAEAQWTFEEKLKKPVFLLGKLRGTSEASNLYSKFPPIIWKVGRQLVYRKQNLSATEVMISLTLLSVNLFYFFICEIDFSASSGCLPDSYGAEVSREAPCLDFYNRKILDEYLAMWGVIIDNYISTGLCRTREISLILILQVN